MTTLRRALAWLLTPDSSDALPCLLTAWRLWLVGALLGALLAAGVYALFPPPYQARASVLVDHNLEEAWTYYPDRQLFYFLERESRKLEEVAWSDATLVAVSAQLGGLDVAGLRAGTLTLSQPRDGAWHFWAKSADPQQAEQLAAAWAAAFVEQANASLAASPDLEAARQALQAALEARPEPDEAEVTALMDELAAISEATPGISPYIQVTLSQSEQLPVERATPQAGYLLAGSLLGVVLLALLALILLPTPQRDRPST